MPGLKLFEGDEVVVLEEPTPVNDAALLFPNGEFEGLNDDWVDPFVELALDFDAPLFPYGLKPFGAATELLEEGDGVPKPLAELFSVPGGLPFLSSNPARLLCPFDSKTAGEVADNVEPLGGPKLVLDSPDFGEAGAFGELELFNLPKLRELSDAPKLGLLDAKPDDSFPLANPLLDPLNPPDVSELDPFGDPKLGADDPFRVPNLGEAGGLAVVETGTTLAVAVPNFRFLCEDAVLTRFEEPPSCKLSLPTDGICWPSPFDELPPKVERKPGGVFLNESSLVKKFACVDFVKSVRGSSDVKKDRSVSLEAEECFLLFLLKNDACPGKYVLGSFDVKKEESPFVAG